MYNIAKLALLDRKAFDTAEAIRDRSFFWRQHRPGERRHQEGPTPEKRENCRAPQETCGKSCKKP